MKIALKDLKKALAWIETNSSDILLKVEMDPTDQRFMLIKCQDKYQVQVEIKLFNDSNMMPRITKEDQLP